MPVKTGSVRLVHRFPGSDLVLVHLPVSPSVTFQLAPGPPARDSTVFGYGSTLSGSASAGRILRVARRNQTWKLTTSVPLRKGDSGGPVMDPSGRLVAIISRSQTRPFSSELSATIANGVSPAIIHSLIAQDRGR